MTEQEQQIHVGGSIEQALKGELKLDIGAIFKEAWGGARGFDRYLVAPFLMLIGISLALGAVLMELMGLWGWSVETVQGQSLLQLVLVVMLAPALAGLQLMAVHLVVGLKPPLPILWHWYRQGPVLSLAALMMLTLVNLGTALFILPGLFLQVALWPVLMLVADKGLSPIAAIKTALQISLKYFRPLLLSQLLALLAVITGALTFGLAMIWLMPLYLRFQGILYRELFGVSMRLGKAQPQATFNA
ncbi:hypothetical protein PVT67_08835 [Gallaecimonas kandeliae]|uniref:hypothetical protein n=1 Tax=Gallaecimonas kandeliae TaxID=3029055 RepID=UPI00264731DB|nr:hypothetical protein [Gallaecimonas kandeliae]WKE67319.1 hypothetical protein PVT67_08835 [Gallaecimonas kandeliae]